MVSPRLYALGLGLIAFMGASGFAHAQSDTQLYAGLEIKRAFESFDNAFTDGVAVDDSIGLGAQLGLRFGNPQERFHLAFEAKFNWYDEFDLGVSPLSGSIEAWSVSLRPKLYFIVGDRIQLEPYVFGGFGWARGKVRLSGVGSTSESDWLWEAGGGLEVPVLDALSVFVEAGYVSPMGDLDGADLWTLGVGLNFRTSLR